MEIGHTKINTITPLVIFNERLPCPYTDIDLLFQLREVLQNVQWRDPSKC